MPESEIKKDITLTGREEFRVKRFALVVGLIGLAISIGLGIVAFCVPSEAVGLLILSVMMVFLCIPIIISYVVTRLYVDAEGIEHRNGLGIRKRINWREVEATYFLGNGSLVVCGANKKIKIEPGYQNGERLDEWLKQYCPNGFKIKDAAAIIGSGVRVEDKVISFRIKRSIFISGLVLIVFGLVFFLIISDIRYAYLILLSTAGLLAVLAYALARVYTDDEKIVYRNLFGRVTRIRWEEIKSIDVGRPSILVIESSRDRIRVSSNFSGFDLLHAIVIQKSPKNVQGF